MSYTIDRVNQLAEAVRRSRFGSIASLRAAGTPSNQHNSKTTKAKPAQKTAAKKVAAPAPSKKTAAKKTAAKKTPAKKAAKKS